MLLESTVALAFLYCCRCFRSLSYWSIVAALEYFCILSFIVGRILSYWSCCRTGVWIVVVAQWPSSPCFSPWSSPCLVSRPTLHITRFIIFYEEASCRGDGLLQRRPPFEEASCGSGDCLLATYISCIHLCFNFRSGRGFSNDGGSGWPAG